MSQSTQLFVDGIIGQCTLVDAFFEQKDGVTRVLTSDEKRAYNFYGCVLIEDLFDPSEINLLSCMADEVLDMRGSGITCAFEPDSTANVDIEEGDDVHMQQETQPTQRRQRLCRVEGFVPRHKGFTSVVKDRLAPLVAQLLGEECCLFKEKMNIKHPRGGGGYAAHFDGPSVAATDLAEKFVTAQLAIDDQTLENGTLEVVMPRSACPWFDDCLSEEECVQAAMIAPIDNDPDAGGRMGAIAPEIAAECSWQAVPCPAGSVLLFHGLFPHRSPANKSNGVRRTGYFIFNAKSDGGDCHDIYKLIMASKREAANVR